RWSSQPRSGSTRAWRSRRVVSSGRWRQARRRSLSGGAANGFDVVAVGVMYEGAVIAGLVLGPHAWFMEHVGIKADRCPGRMPALAGGPRGRSRTLAWAA